MKLEEIVRWIGTALKEIGSSLAATLKRSGAINLFRLLVISEPIYSVIRAIKRTRFRLERKTNSVAKS